MADTYIPRKNPAVTDVKIDAEEVTVGANTVVRERLQIVDGQSATPIPLSVLSNGGANSLVVSQQPLAANGTPTSVNLVADTPLQIASASTTRKCILIQNPETATVNIYVGTSGSVTTGTGVCIIPGGSAVDESWKGDLYLVASANTSAIVWEKST